MTAIAAKDGEKYESIIVSKGEYPFVVIVQSMILYFYCLGSIVTKEHIMTTCSCFVYFEDGYVHEFEPQMFRVVSGKRTFESSPLQDDGAIQFIYYHNLFSMIFNVVLQAGYAHDICIIKLKTSLQFTDEIKPLTTVSSDLKEVWAKIQSLSAEGATCLAFGFGYKHVLNAKLPHGDNRLRKAYVVLLKDCSPYVPLNRDEDFKFLLCGRVSSNFTFDVGSPLICGKNVHAVFFETRQEVSLFVSMADFPDFSKLNSADRLFSKVQVLIAGITTVVVLLGVYAY
ncbi:uncharacterized protein LOC106664788 [Cimex lectularius]|uniref:Peptidase S1 domain-containing protein n=1 Tax=Cimex lectularius TaxID=79782 RepID=A0A8I6TDD9_CIMLE|nr:uncharacterized protein LOC106664788 [Cimex lectularius]